MQRSDAFPTLRYAQCWEDADVLLAGLGIQPGDRCLSISSAGDNTLAMLSHGPKLVLAIDSNPAQIACLELRVAAYRLLNYQELLELIGSRPSNHRLELYRRCEGALSTYARSFWNARLGLVHSGIGGAGRLELYFALFRKHVLPHVHTGERVQRLLQGGEIKERREFFWAEWNTRRWRWAVRFFFSRFLMGRLGRDASAFRHADDSLARLILEQCVRGLTELDPAGNPYLHWILVGTHSSALPYHLRPGPYAAIRKYLDRLEWQCVSLQDYLERAAPSSFDRFNLSNTFEYMSEPEYHRTLGLIDRCSRPRSRMLYWNLLVRRRRPFHMSRRVERLRQVEDRLRLRNKTFFYRDLVVEERRALQEAAIRVDQGLLWRPPAEWPQPHAAQCRG